MTWAFLSGRARLAAGVLGALLSPLAAHAQGNPTPCAVVNNIATCSLDDSEGIVFTTVAAGGTSTDPNGVTSIVTSGLTRPIAPDGLFQALFTPGIGLFYDLSATHPTDVTTTGLSGPALSVTTDASQPINITGSNANGALPFALNGAIMVRSTGGSGFVPPPFDPLSNPPSLGGPGGDAGAGSAITVTNHAVLTLALTDTPQSRAVVFGLGGELNDQIAARDFANAALSCLADSNCAANPNQQLAYFECFFGGGTVVILGSALCVGGNFTGSNSQLATDITNQVLAPIQDRIDFLNAPPAPGETGSLVVGAITATSVGGTGGSTTQFLDPHNRRSGNGGDGGSVTVINTATITVSAASGFAGGNSAGIVAISQGGQGGNGFDNFDQPLPPPSGFGGDGGTVLVSNSGAITTTVVSTPGIFAESVGGNQGDHTVASGSAGGAVTIDNTGAITTTEINSYGLFAKSQGGGNIGIGSVGTGGTGGLATIDNDGAITTSGDFAYGAYAVSAGGKGGDGSGSGNGFDGGPGGTANILLDTHSVIVTTGTDAIGAYALSIAGVGGVGGSDSGIFWADAGGAGNGGKGGEAFVTNKGTISTAGDFAYGVFGQSLGGTGGIGGSAGALVAESGSGGGGAPAGDVTLENDGSIVTEGANAYGLYAQSLAGAGGDAGSSGGFVALGSDGGNGAQQACQNDPTKCLNGGTVIISNAGSILTHGFAADGILGESIGGGGGNGGSASGLFSYGGSGGAGGNGGVVTISNLTGASIATTGDTAVGIFAQSIGGGGGKGGNATSFGTGASFAIGGSGGSGGFGNSVTVANNGAISDSGLGVTGIFAQSIGGGGGSGGDASATSLAVTVSIGGSGGGGGKGGAVTVTNDKSGTISVSGFQSTGIFAQSVGGGGGNGGSATSTSVGVGFAAAVAIGGHGADGAGAGDLVSVTNNGAISTAGDFSDAMFVQSVGGGGGNGGAAFTTAAAVGGGEIPAISIGASVGGDGGHGGDGGQVNIANTGTILTLDWDSFGIFAQSVGGGGGDGGSSTAKALAGAEGLAVAASFAVGGAGGAAGAGAEVDVNNSGTVTTFGDQSVAVFAQSVGGGGGNGGDASTTTYTLTGGNAGNVNVSVGGKGGAGGNGGAVHVINTGTVVTLGNMANAITAQSVGGGGGNGGAGTQEPLFDFIDLPTDFDKDTFNKPLKDQARDKFDSLKKTLSDLKADPAAFGKNFVKDQLKGLTEKPQSIGISIGVGGQGGAGGDGLDVTVANANEVITGGFMSFGIFAQSVGGGGGSGGGGDASGDGDINVGAGVGGASGGAGKGGTVGVTNTGDITTFGNMADAIFAQSVGGGGGVAGAGGGSSSGARSLSLSIGGISGSGGNGDAVTVLQNGNVVTAGNNAIGVFAQSIGGGGGVGGAATAANYLNVSVGGAGGAAGNGGAVNVTVMGSIATLGDLAHGVFAQSVGGGGGLGGAVEASTLEIGVAPLGLYTVDTGIPVAVGVVGVGGAGGNAGNGGAVTVNTSGTISTSGRGADGIFAQSIGGGGGSGGTSNLPLGGALPINGSNGGLGVAGKIDITHTGSIFATGVDANGIVAQSMGGSAEAIPFGNSFIAGAANPDGLGDNITIRLLGFGTVSGGSGAAAGIVLAGGKDNLIDNEGGTITALSNVAILGGSGNDTVENNGLVHGTVGLGGGTNSFHNGAKGTFESGQFVFINAGSTLLNDGILSPGGAGIVQTTTMTGNLTDSATATLLVDVSFKGGASDLVTMDGTASLAGKALLGPHHATDLVVGKFVTVLTASSIVDDGISIDDTLTVDYGVRVAGNAFQVGVNAVNFVLPGAVLTPDETSIARHLQDAWAAGGGGLIPLLDVLAGMTDPKAYADTIGALDPATGTTLSSALLFAGSSFTGSLMSCPGSSDPEDALHEHECYWGRISGFEANQDPTAKSFQYGNHGERFQLGRQFAVAPQWFVGVTGGYEYDGITSGSAVQGSDRIYNAGLVGKREEGPWTFAAAVDGSYGDGKLARAITLPAFVVARSAPQQYFLDAKLRASYLRRSGWFYAKPSVEADLYYLSVPGFHEHGAGPLDVITRDASKVFGSGSAGLEIGGIFQDAQGSVFRPYVSGGVLAYTDNRWDVTARFEGSPPGVPDFKVSNSFPDLLGRVTAGVDASMGDSTAKFEYEAHFGSHYLDQTGSVKLELRL